jgi:hypothetical protein
MRHDREIYQTVQGTLERDNRFATTDLRVEVHHGMVTLLGTVEGYALRSTAGAIAAGVPGVTEVVNRIKVTLNGAASRRFPRRPADRTPSRADHSGPLGVCRPSGPPSSPDARDHRPGGVVDGGPASRSAPSG